MDELLAGFLSETSESLAQLGAALIRLEHAADNGATLALIFRLVHSIKGTSGFFGLKRLEILAHAVESRLSRVRDGSRPATPELVAAVLATLGRIGQIVARLCADGTEPDGEDTALIASLGIPSANVQSRLAGLVQQLGRELGKRIELVTADGETDLDRQIPGPLTAPLIHLLRNAADHGLEPPWERRAAGKPETGRITLSTRRHGGHIVIEIEDDGRGLSTEKIRAAALAQELASPEALAGMSEARLQRLVFRPGFSTAAEITAISGRGVGLDVVKTTVERIGGSVTLRGVPGQGTRVTLTVPLRQFRSEIEAAELLAAD